jgi:hypothetical protein
VADGEVLCPHCGPVAPASRPVHVLDFRPEPVDVTVDVSAGERDHAVVAATASRQCRERHVPGYGDPVGDQGRAGSRSVMSSSRVCPLAIRNWNPAGQVPHPPEHIERPAKLAARVVARGRVGAQGVPSQVGIVSR